jgi:hypothetical protein
MAGGKRIKFQDSRMQLLYNWHADSPSDSVSAITKANPAVVTSASHGRSDGDVIRINGALGMTEVNGEPYVIDVQNSNTYQLLGVNSSDYGTYTSGGRVDVAMFSTFCELTGWNRQGGTSPEIGATSQCSEAQEFEFGLPDFGTMQIDYNFAPQVAVYQALEEAYLAGDKLAYKLTFIPAALANIFLIGFGTITQMSDSGQVGGMLTGSLSLRLSGRRYIFGV